MKEQLRQWLNGARDFRTGTALYCLLGDNEAMKRLLKKGRTDYLQERLEKELDQLFDQLVPTAPEIDTPVQKIETPVPKNPDLEAVCYAKAKQLYKQQMNDRAILFALAKVAVHQDPNTPDLIEQRRQFALSICDQNYDVSKAYDDLEYVKKYGELPGITQEEVKSIITVPDHQLKHTINNLRKNLGKMRKREQTPERISLIQKHESDLQELLERWNKLTAHEK